MSMRTNDPSSRALAMIARRFSTHSLSSMASPIWVSFTETFASAPAWRMRSSVSRYVSRAARASAGPATDSPSRSRLALMPAAVSRERAATAASTVSPATKREAKRRARPFPRMTLNRRGCSLSQRRPVRSIEDGGQGSEVRGQGSGVSVKPGAVARLLLQHLARSEARPEALGKALELRDETLGPEVVGVAQRAAAERRKPEAEHRGDIAVARTRHDALSHRARGLVEHRENEPLDRLRRARAAVRLRADELVHGRVY